MKLKKSLVLIALSSLAVAARAVDVTSISSTNYPTGWYTAEGGTASQLAANPSNDSDGALRFNGSASGYVSYGAYRAYSGSASSTFPSLGTLGALIAPTGSMSADFFRSSASNTNDNLVNVAVKIIFSGNRQLTWENAYNASVTTTDSWFNQTLSSGNWWLRGANLPDKSGDNLGTLADWAAGKSPTGYTGAPLSLTSEVLGYTLGFGSGVGSFDGAIDHLSVNYAGGTQTTYNFKTQAVPEPSSFAALALGGAALLRRRKRAR